MCKAYTPFSCITVIYTPAYRTYLHPTLYTVFSSVGAWKKRYQTLGWCYHRGAIVFSLFCCHLYTLQAVLIYWQFETVKAIVLSELIKCVRLCERVELVLYVCRNSVKQKQRKKKHLTDVCTRHMQKCLV